MLQDVEGGRYIEIDALVGSVVELGNLVDIPTPSTFAVYACCKLLGDLINHERIYVRAEKLS
jgi:2-dehydropantoate 2-reductase